MSVPQPESTLSGHCAAIENEILYVLDNDGAFQSLPLKKNATWGREETGQAVSAPACAQDDSAGALYVLGGESDSNDYKGLQRYFFANQTWETLMPLADVLQNRVNHSVAYLKDSQKILVYAGSSVDQPSDLSSQTFLLSTEPPYVIDSFTSNAPPANNPILQPWNSSHALMVGGQTTSNQVWLFGPDEGWTQLATDLTAPLDPTARAVVIDGTDGSKVLQVFDMHTSPNAVEGIVLVAAGGQPASIGQTVGGANSSRKRKRDLSLSDWPSYNDTNAPTSTRTDCSIVRDADGLVVMAGGNDDHPLIMYNQSDNSWLDANKFFSSKQQQPLLPSSTSSTATTPPTETSTAATTTQAAPVGGPSAHDRTMKTLGITLGVLCSIAAIFILILLYLRYRKLKAKKKDGYLEEKTGAGGDGGRLSFVDRGASFMKEAGLSQQDLVPPNQFGKSTGSHTSLSIMAGKWGNGSSRHLPSGQPLRGSFESTTPMVKNRDGKIVPTENHEMMDIGDKVAMPRTALAAPGSYGNAFALDKETRSERKRSSGWSKYFATSQPTGLSHLPSAYIKPTTRNDDSEYSHEQERSTEMSHIPTSKLVPPLDVDFSKTVDGQRLSHVASGSPAFRDSREDITRTPSNRNPREGQTGQILDARSSRATSITSYDNRSTISSNVTSEYFHEIQTPWTPMSGEAAMPRGRPTSSIYANSVQDTGRRVPSRGKSAGFFPGAGTTYKSTRVKLSHAAGPTSEWASPRAPGLTNLPADSRDSTVTVFPGADFLDKQHTDENRETPQSVAGAPRPSRIPKPANTDMSWLNLGLSRSQT